MTIDTFFDQLIANAAEPYKDIPANIKATWETRATLTQKQRAWLRGNPFIRKGEVKVPTEIQDHLLDCEAEDRVAREAISAPTSPKKPAGSGARLAFTPEHTKHKPSCDQKIDLILEEFAQAIFNIDQRFKGAA